MSSVSSQEIFYKFKNIFISPKNTQYLLQHLYKKYEYANIDSLTYEKTLYQVQIDIFDGYFNVLYQNMSKNGNINMEDLLVTLNKTTINKFDDVITKYLQQYSSPSSSNLSTPLSSPYSQRQLSPQLQRQLSPPMQPLSIQQQNTLSQPQQLSQQLSPPIQQLSQQLNQQQIQLPQQLSPPLQQLSLQPQNTQPQLSQQPNQQQLQLSQQPNQLPQQPNQLPQQPNQPQIQLPQQPNQQLSSKTPSVFSDLEYDTQCYHFFAQNAEMTKPGCYMYNLNYQKLKSIQLQTFTIDCNIYNINELNNYFYITEKGHKYKVHIPVGYYPIDELTHILTKLLNEMSPNKFRFNITRNKHKNKIYFQCDSPFNLEFADKTSVNMTLYNILGFQKTEYMNNTIYMSENHPIQNILNHLYLKIYINQKELSRTITSNNFAYYGCFNIDLNKHFGTTLHLPLNTEIFDLFDNIDVKTLSFELYDTNFQLLTNRINFDCTLLLEYSS